MFCVFVKLEVINTDFLKQTLEIKYGGYKSIKDIFR